MKHISHFVFVALITMFVAGCAVKDTDQKIQEWKEGPFTKVKAWDRLGLIGEQADAWVECEPGDKLDVRYQDRFSRDVHRARVVFILRKDGTKWSLPVEVHDPDGRTLRVNTYHLTVKGKEVNFFQP